MGVPYPLVHELFLDALGRGPDRVFLRQLTRGGELRRSFHEVAAGVARTVDHLRAIGVGRGDRAVIYADAIVPSVHYMLACAFGGVAFAPVAPARSPESVRELQDRLAAKVVLTTREHVARLRAAGIRALHDGEGEDALDLSGAAAPGDLDALRACSAGRTSDEPYVILPASGRGGEPALPVLPHLACSLAARRFGEALGPAAGARERLLLCSPLTDHVGQAVLAFGLHLGAELCIPDAPGADASLEQVQRLDCSVACVRPPVVQALYRQHLARGGRPHGRFFGPSLRFLRTGGSPIEPELLGKLSAEGIDVGEWYGASEAPMIAITPHAGWRRGEVGRVCEDVEVRLAGDGEILVRSPAAADGLLATGDLGELSPEGGLRVAGPRRDVLRAPDGARIAAGRIEAAICALPWVEQAVVVGDARPFAGALIVARDRDGAPDEAELRARRRDLSALNAWLEPFEQVRSFELLRERFAAPLYADVAPGKVRRDRAAIAAAYAAQIEALYARPRDLPMRTESASWQVGSWDASADDFDTTAMSFAPRISARVVELMDLAAGARVLDCACGTGNASLPAAERVGPQGRVIGVDFSAGLLALARAKAAARGLGNVEFRLGDMQQLALGAEPFDAVFCIFALFFVPDMVAQVRRFWNHLRPGGRLGIAIWEPDGLEPALKQIWLPTLLRERPDLLAQQAALERVSEVVQLRAILADAEVTDVELVTCREAQQLDVPERWWEVLLGIAPLRWFIDQLTPEQRARVQQANIDGIREHRVTSVSANWIFARATKPTPRA